MSDFFYFDNEGDTSDVFVLDLESDPVDPYNEGKGKKEPQVSSDSKNNDDGDQEKSNGELLLPEHVKVAQDRKGKGKQVETERDDFSPSGEDRRRRKRKRGEQEDKDENEDENENENENEDEAIDEDEGQHEINDGTGDFIQLDAKSRGVSDYYDDEIIINAGRQNAKEVSRYYEADEDKQRRMAKVCETCGERGHDKRECDHLLCVACGAFDEHDSRNCPMKMVCFNCGEPGHILRKCPTRMIGQCCDRCGSRDHVEMACPSFWRIYAYNSDNEYARGRALAATGLERQRKAEGGDFSPVRKRKRTKGSTKGDSDMDLSEGEMSPEELIVPRADWDPAELWCYNCAAKGAHLGDDCPHPRASHKRSVDPSAFSDFTATSGPFGRMIPKVHKPDPRLNNKGHFDFGNHHQHFDFSVGPSASMHVAGIEPGPGFRDEHHYENDMAAIDALFDPSKRSKSKRSSSKGKERDARAEARDHSRSEKRRRSPSLETRSDKSREKEKDRKRHSKSRRVSDDYDVDVRSATFDNGLSRRLDWEEANRNKYPFDVPESSALAKKIRLKMLQKVDCLQKKQKRGRKTHQIEILEEKVARYEKELHARGVVIGKGLNKTDKAEIRMLNGEWDYEQGGGECFAVAEGSDYQHLDDYVDGPHYDRSYSSSRDYRDDHYGSNRADRYEQMKLEKEDRLRLQNRGGPSDHRNGAPRQRYGEPSFGQFSTDGYSDRYDQGGRSYEFESSGRNDGNRSSSAKKRGGHNSKSNVSGARSSNSSNGPKYNGSY